MHSLKVVTTTGVQYWRVNQLSNAKPEQQKPETSAPEIPLKILSRASRCAGIRKNTSILGWCETNTASVLGVKNKPVCPREKIPPRDLRNWCERAATCVRVELCVRVLTCARYTVRMGQLEQREGSGVWDPPSLCVWVSFRVLLKRPN